MDYAKQLLQKYLNGYCTTEEKRQLYRYLLQSEAKDYDEVLHALWAELSDVPQPDTATSDRIYQSVVASQTTSEHRFLAKKKWYIAASLTGVLTVLAAWYYLLPHTQTYETQYSEVKTLVLPDSSIVYLNANSKITYSSDLAENTTREVWLSGEAYFEITRRQAPSNQPVKMIVHTAQVDIEVLGTAFNVKDRRGITQVVLDEGKVRLRSPQSDDELVAMEPGEAVQVNQQQLFSVEKIGGETHASSWKENELYFDNQSLREIQQVLADNYGLQLRFANFAVGELTFTGSAPADNISVLFTTLEKSFSLSIEEINGEYVVRRKP
ncbi:FecR family protein [Tunicatimonas pelagia]|uniref:FecR family protein n=1 Tax=Tunicatimonas pelagia TaxID=931531 RepID=UPI0026656887|nr:FecR domain-containing protein [Tunicatimonas pelagia]WKN41438.1 FecR domain-containing protein [Tunicatimonas pelagia]